MSDAQGHNDDLVTTFESSLARCLQAGNFITAFYERFMASSDDVKRKFQDTNFEKQKKILETSLYLMARAALGMEDGIAHLESVARRHSKRQLDITPSHYGIWLERLVDTVRDFDPDFSMSVENAWRQLLQHSIDRMVDVYRKEETVPPPRAKRESDGT